MRHPARLESLVEQGIIDDVVRPLLAGKEAEVYLVVVDGMHRVAKVYKDATQRSFKHRATYTEGRKGRNTRRERALQKRSKFGRAEEELAWRSAEVDAIYRLRDAGVTVPEPFDFIDGVLVMELVAGHDGGPAPRLCDMRFEPEEAQELFHLLLREVVRMLCAGLIHGDLSDFNVLLGVDGPVVIDFPQAVDAAANQSARKLLVRDVDNLQRFLGRWSPGLKHKRYGEEMWALYQSGELHPDTPLTGRYRGQSRQADTDAVLREIAAAEDDNRRRLGLDPMQRANPPAQVAAKAKPKGKSSRRTEAAALKAERAAQKYEALLEKRRAPPPPPQAPPPVELEAAPSKKKRRRRRKRKPEAQAPVELDPFDDLDALLSSD